MIKRPWIAALLSLLIAGAGQIYNREFLKGIVLLLSSFAIFIVSGVFPAILPVAILIWLFSIWDAYTRAVMAVRP